MRQKDIEQLPVGWRSFASAILLEDWALIAPTECKLAVDSLSLALLTNDHNGLRRISQTLEWANQASAIPDQALFMVMATLKVGDTWVLEFPAAQAGPQQTYRPLIDLVKRHRNRWSQFFRNTKAPINHVYSDGRTLLADLCLGIEPFSSFTDALRLGAQPKAGNVPPLHCCDYTYVEAILRAGCPVDFISPDGLTALMAQSRPLPGLTTEVLLRNGASINLLDPLAGIPVHGVILAGLIKVQPEALRVRILAELARSHLPVEVAKAAHSSEEWQSHVEAAWALDSQSIAR